MVSKILENLEVVADLNVTSGLKNRSRWTSTLAVGNNIDIFHKLVMSDLDKLNRLDRSLSGNTRFNLSPGEGRALDFLTDQTDYTC